MLSSSLLLSNHGDFAELVLNRPEKRNAVSYEMWQEFPSILSQIEQDRSVKLLILRGQGNHFSAGADISEFRTHRSGPEGVRKYNEVVKRAEQAFIAFSKPSLAMIRGFCLGGGCELALVCDIRLAGSSARMGITPAKLGIVYPFEATRQLVTTVGSSFAKYMLFSAEQIPAEKALQVGLVDEVFHESELAEQTEKLAQTICARSQVSVRGSKLLIGKVAAGQTSPDAEAGALPIKAVESPDYSEGVQAFLEQRSPRFEQ